MATAACLQYRGINCPSVVAVTVPHGAAPCSAGLLATAVSLALARVVPLPCGYRAHSASEGSWKPYYSAVGHPPQGTNPLKHASAKIDGTCGEDSSTCSHPRQRCGSLWNPVLTQPPFFYSLVIFVCFQGARPHRMPWNLAEPPIRPSPLLCI